MQKTKRLLVFPDGVGIRNYLYSGVFEAGSAALVLWHNFSPETVAYLRESVSLAEETPMPHYRESFKERFLRELICHARLRYNARLEANAMILDSWPKRHKGFSKSVFYKAIECTSGFFSEYSRILKLETRYQKALRQNPFYFQIRQMLAALQPDSVFCSHQRGLKMAAIFAAASDLGIRTTTVIYSWDNLPKARLALRADRYEVWSGYMKSEIGKYYPEIDQKSVIVTGTPQFSFYSDSSYIIPKDEFYERYGLDASKKIICYSGDDVKTSPDDPKYLRDIAFALKQSGLESDYQILFRACPVDTTGRFDPVLAEFPQIIRAAPPLWSGSEQSWTDKFALREDVSLLVSTVFYSDMVFNIGSTMVFDFRMFNKPCVFINYDQAQKTDPDWSVLKIYKYQHFRSMPSDQSVVWLNNRAEIATKIANIKQYYNAEQTAAWLKKIASIAPVN